MNTKDIPFDKHDLPPNGKERKFRYLARHQLVRFTSELEKFLAYDPAQLVKSCVNCDHFKESNEMCQKANARPPARIIAFGCELYDNIDDEIPF